MWWPSGIAWGWHPKLCVGWQKLRDRWWQSKHKKCGTYRINLRIPLFACLSFTTNVTGENTYSIYLFSFPPVGILSCRCVWSQQSVRTRGAGGSHPVCKGSPGYTNGLSELSGSSQQPLAGTVWGATTALAHEDYVWASKAYRPFVTDLPVYTSVFVVQWCLLGLVRSNHCSQAYLSSV